MVITHSNGIQTYYGHCSKLYVNEGDIIQQGQEIAEVGATGNATGPHLHFEIRKNGERVDGLNYVSEENPRPKDNKGYVGGNDNQQAVCLQ